MKTPAMEKLRRVVASLPCRLLMLATGVVLLGIMGVSLLANFINPMSWSDFLVAIYFAVAGVFAFMHFFTKKLAYFLVAAPATVFLVIVFALWPPH
ncbi:hypothetical protein OR1_02453 [Geobacter sp. OR-1]|uniref:hypothetical protein n=1 Tax=Geobacter sp. OR-1 TaxID=1266765 RepID=UPI00054323C9|nr:hypothetical protein [Geobacter sp. OR-1]GAM10165.1 hypothetical protein OR1_02453 [Geobacter sp. OR-1]